MDIRKKVGRNVRKFRKEADWSQEDLAFECDLHRTYISGVERGVRNPTVMILNNIAQALGIQPYQLLQ